MAMPIAPGAPLTPELVPDPRPSPCLPVSLTSDQDPAADSGTGGVGSGVSPSSFFSASVTAPPIRRRSCLVFLTHESRA